MYYLTLGIAIGIIPLKFVYHLGTLRFLSWRLFILISFLLCGLVALTLEAFSYETPKFLLYNIGSEASFKVLRRVYVWNTGKDVDSFPVSK